MDARKRSSGTSVNALGRLRDHWRGQVDRYNSLVWKCSGTGFGVMNGSEGQIMTSFEQALNQVSHGLSAGHTLVTGSPVAAIAGRIVGIETGNHFFSMFDALPPIGEEPGAEPAEYEQINTFFFV